MKLDSKQRKLDELIKELKEKGFKYIPREEREIDWSKYDEAQIHEINDMLLMIRDTVDEAALRLGIKGAKFEGPGRPPYPPEDLVKAVLMQQYFGVANRGAAGLVLLFQEKMGIKQAFSYKTIERAYDDPLVTLILNEVFRMTQKPVGELEKNFSADGTGLSTSMKQNWGRDKDDEKKRDGYEKMVAMVGTTYGLISAVEFPDNPAAHESPFFKQLLEETADCYPTIELVSLDAAYLSRDNCNVIEEVSAVPRIYPKGGATLKRRGSWAWTEMLLDFINDPQQWLRDYHLRSISETVFSTYKRDFITPLRRRILRRRKREAFTRVCDYNMKRLCYLRYLKGISVPWKNS
ncbi:MAG: transposase [Candidatus Hadarchaeum sp.]|uniref:transposase n=1 Tax=Candidatus Hadarchaeum sp. TaxID=2883567 RepID=UPI003D0C0276